MTGTVALFGDDGDGVEHGTPRGELSSSETVNPSRNCPSKAPTQGPRVAVRGGSSRNPAGTASTSSEQKHPSSHPYIDPLPPNLRFGMTGPEE